MKKLLLISILYTGLFSAQNVGIGTDTPTRKLDVNGDLRIRSANVVTGNTNYNRIIAADKNTGNVDYVTVSSIPQDETNNVEVKRSIYLATTPITANECNCGDMTFRLNNNGTPEFKLNSTTIFLTNNNITTFDLGYGIKRWSGSSYNYKNRFVTFTTSNYSTYQVLDDVAISTAVTSEGNTVRVYTIIPPKQNNLYKVTVSRTNNNNTSTFAYGVICERFYMQSL